jgi:hypothetical protein
VGAKTVLGADDSIWQTKEENEMFTVDGRISRLCNHTQQAEMLTAEMLTG